MQERIATIYEELYSGVKNKHYFANKFNVTTKTIENTIAKIEDIIYDKKLSAYRFATLLPKYIHHNLVVRLLQNSISNEIAKDDFLTISNILKENKEILLPMIPTQVLSSLTKKLIMLEVAICSNCIIKVEYISNKKPMEIKYIKPHKINTSENSYYLYGSYDEQNKNNIGEYRSFAVNSMHNITPVEWLKGEKFFIEGIGNAYGMITKEKFVTLKLTASAANYFKRERQFSKEQYDFILEEADGAVVMKMYYNNLQEVIKLVQQWMPYICIENNPNLAQKVYRIIQKNMDVLLKNYEEA
ncbi:WYL domain-containing protein [Sulfurimonas sp. NW7]|uniref:WYL domain-containing protein n=1 Tax=Sulfurimonas sp. NW7 TaxID=2922727 RepID=UPI003DA7CCEC